MVPPPQAEPQQAPQVLVDASNAEGLQALVVAEDNPRSIKSRIAVWALRRMQGRTNKQIAEEMGIAQSTLRAHIHRASKEGWLQVHDPDDKIEQVLLPAALEVIEKNFNSGDPSIKAALDVLKGTGHFKSFQAIKQETINTNINIDFKIDIPDEAEGDAAMGLADILGTGREPSDIIDGVVVERGEDDE